MDVEDERAPLRRLSGVKRERFLEVLGQTGNRTTAATAIGVEPRLMDQRRRFDPTLDADWTAAVAQADRRLSGSDGPFDCIGGGGMNVVRRGRGGRLQIVRAGPKRWSRKIEDRYLAALGRFGNFAAAARAIGFSESSATQRRHKWPDLARRIEEALEEADLAIEFRLAHEANDVRAFDHEADDGEAPDDTSPATGRDSTFDRDFALRYLKWRQEKKAGRGRRGRVPEPPSLEAVTEKIVRKVEAIRKHRARGGRPPAPDRREEDGR
jgi:hypothetical protein